MFRAASSQIKRVIPSQTQTNGLLIRSLANQAEPAKKTCLYDLNVKHQGKMVEFAGYLMPVQYGAEGIAASHLHVRSSCGLFDVSHMLQSHVHG